MLWVFGVFFWFLFGCVWYCVGTVQLLFCLRVVSVGCGWLWLAARGFPCVGVVFWVCISAPFGMNRS